MSRQKILIVDDDKSVSTVVKIALEDVYDVIATNTGAKALQYLSERKVDLIILDINMPGMSGIETLEEIKKTHPDSVVIMLTSYASTENLQKAISYGAYGFILKPFDLDSLRNYVDTAFNFKKNDNAHDKGLVHKTLLHEQDSVR